MSRPPQPLKSGDEHDAFTAWRRFVKWVAGERARIKARFNRRVRREGREKLRRGEEN